MGSAFGGIKTKSSIRCVLCYGLAELVKEYNIDIPSEINAIIFMYYFIDYYLFHSTKDSQKIMITLGGKIVTKTTIGSNRATPFCLAESIKSDEVYEYFDLNIKCKHLTRDFIITFFPDGIKDLDDNVKQVYKKRINKYYCKHGHDYLRLNIKYSTFHHNDYRYPKSMPGKPFENGDVLKLRIDFKEDMMKLYKDGIFVTYLALDGHKNVTPMFAVVYAEDCIEIID